MTSCSRVWVSAISPDLAPTNPPKFKSVLDNPSAYVHVAGAQVCWTGLSAAKGMYVVIASCVQQLSMSRGVVHVSSQAHDSGQLSNKPYKLFSSLVAATSAFSLLLQYEVLACPRSTYGASSLPQKYLQRNVRIVTFEQRQQLAWSAPGPAAGPEPSAGSLRCRVVSSAGTRLAH